MKTDLTLAYSTCPNDTFIFNALINGRIDTQGLTFSPVLTDVEELNRAAETGIYDISKLSFAALAHLKGKYTLLKSGAALGRGCGPLIIARPGYEIEQLASSRIAVPGIWTTASLLLELFLKKPANSVPMSFEKIMPEIQRKDGDINFGVIIHEGRFTYKEYGLTEVLDLGQWWEETTSLPIPLGGIAVRSDISTILMRKVEHLVRQSLHYALENRETAYHYIKQYAQEMEENIIWRHIDLYVNEFSSDLGEVGQKAVDMLFRLGQESGILPHQTTLTILK